MARNVSLTMSTRTTPTVRYNTQLMAEDMAAKGWSKDDFARRAGVSDMTVIRFLRGDAQTAPTAKKLADALGKGVSRYIVPSEERQQVAS